jgi:hypothetical protein
MVDTKISELTELTSVDSADIIAIVDDPSGGTPVTKKITKANLVKDIAQSDITDLTTDLALKAPLASPTLVTPALGTPSAGVLTSCTGTASGLTAGNVTTNANLTGDVTSSGNATSIASGVIVLGDIANAAKTEALIFAVSDETTAITTGTSKGVFRMPYGFTLTAVRASVTTAGTGSVITVDINETGTTILSTKLTIDATEKTSTTAATAAVISDSALADDAEITIDIDAVDSGGVGAGLKIYLIGYQT